MSQFTDYAENKLADFVRAQAWTISASLYFALASAVTDSAVTELTGTGYARVGIVRNLTNFASTQGNTSASIGTTHTTSNLVAINWGTSGSAWGTANFIVAYDAATGGNPIAYFPISALVIGNAQPVSVAIGALTFSLGLTGGCSDYLANKLIDFVFRAQAFTFPATIYSALLTAACTNAGGGTEVNGAGYTRVVFACNLTNLSGTQGAGTTTASTGTAGLISNNVAITFPTVTASWGTATHAAEYDAASAGNLLFWAPLGAAKTIPAASTPPTYAPAAKTFTFA